MRNIFILISAVTLLLTQACRKGRDADASLTNATPVVTEKGVTNGALKTYVVNAGGGTVVSGDGAVTLVIPAGAVTENTTVGIQPISNNAPLGLGNGYRLTPEGTHFDKPVTLQFNYSNIPLNNAVPDFLWITTQNEDGTWSADTKSEVDTIAKTVTVTTTHFSDWALGRFVDLKLEPVSATVKVKEGVTLVVTGFLKAEDEETGALHPLAPIGSDLAPIGRVAALLEKTEKYQDFKINEWALNGVKAPVSNNFGSLEVGDNAARFTAPATRPSPNVVAVSATIEAWQKNGVKTGYMLVSNIAIIDSDYYLSLAVDGQEYYYAQYIPPNIPADPENMNMVYAGIAAQSNALEIRATYVKNGGASSENIFHINLVNPVPGRGSFRCKYDITGEEDEIEFRPFLSATPYLMTYVTRYYNNTNTCIPEYKCSEISYTLREFNGAGKPARGSFSGYVYEDPASYEQACKSSEKHFIKGEFNLLLNSN